MKLYHGTSERAAQTALQEGLLPRWDSKVQSKWEDHPSSADHVYLTVAYSAYFAMSASEEGGRWAILEIDTDHLPDDYERLVPDEDFLEQSTRSEKDRQYLYEISAGDDGDVLDIDASMEERTRWFREHLGWFSHHWEESIRRLGNCAYEGVIPPEAITRVCFVDPTKSGPMCSMALDPMISLLNYAICESKYRSLTRWLFEEAVEPADFGIITFPEAASEDLEGMDPVLRKHVDMAQQQTASYRRMIADRSGVEVSTVNQEGNTQ
jgi:hypothetical protein